jgi:uncharacterized protein YndB with AHSA1/START domain
MPYPASTVRQHPSLRIERDYDVPPEKVWRAWTDPKALIAWFGTGSPGSVTLAEVDVRMGGQFRLEFHTADGEQHSVSGFYLHVVPPHRLQFTWAWRSTPERESLVTLHLVPTATGTHMKFVHAHFFDQAARDGHESGWELTFDKLAQHLHQP